MPDTPTTTCTISTTCNGHSITGTGSNTDPKLAGADAYDDLGNKLEANGCHDRAVAAHNLATYIRNMP